MRKLIRNNIVRLTTAIILGLSIISPLTASAQVNVADGVCGGASLNASSTASVCPTADTTDTTLNSIIITVINYLSFFAGAFAVIMFAFGAYIAVIGSGGKDSGTKARNAVLYALVGLVIVVVAQVIVRIILVKATTTIV